MLPLVHLFVLSSLQARAMEGPGSMKRLPMPPVPLTLQPEACLFVVTAVFVCDFFSVSPPGFLILACGRHKAQG